MVRGGGIRVGSELSYEVFEVKYVILYCVHYMCNDPLWSHTSVFSGQNNLIDQCLWMCVWMYVCVDVCVFILKKLLVPVSFSPIY